LLFIVFLELSALWLLTIDTRSIVIIAPTDSSVNLFAAPRLAHCGDVVTAHVSLQFTESYSCGNETDEFNESQFDV
jgi:hypothetical protein